MDLSYTLPAVIGLGALHSLEPGHGKAIISAYLISTEAKVKDAVIIGLISALAHTLSIALLAFSVTTAIQLLLPENLIYWIQLFSGIGVIYIGLDIILKRLIPQKETSRCNNHVQCDCHGSCGHDHSEPLSKKGSSHSNLFLMGFFTGLVPCPSALALLLAAVSAGKISLGLGLVCAFSVGGAITMVAIGLFVVKASKKITISPERLNVINGIAIASSFIILFLGAVVILESVNHI